MTWAEACQHTLPQLELMVAAVDRRDAQKALMSIQVIIAATSDNKLLKQLRTSLKKVLE